MIKKSLWRPLGNFTIIVIIIIILVYIGACIDLYKNEAVTVRVNKNKPGLTLSVDLSLDLDSAIKNSRKEKNGD